LVVIKIINTNILTY